MTQSVVSIKHLETIYSPFSGLPVDGEDGPNEADKTLLFCYYGTASEFAFVNERISEVLDTTIGVEEAIASIKMDNIVIFRVDTDWNGVNYYGFAP